MKRLARWTKIAAVALTLPLLVVTVNTIRFRTKQVRMPPAGAIASLPGFAERLGRAIRFPTVAAGSPGDTDPRPFDGLREHLAGSFPRVHERLVREVFGGQSLLYRWQGVDPSRRPILLMSHLDVVPVEEGTECDWTRPPFSGEIADGFIWGRGALDVKCGALGLLEAVERLLADGFRPTCDVYLALGHDEETGGLGGNRPIAATLRDRGVRFRFALDEGGGLMEGIIDGIDTPVAYVGIAEKGYATVVLSASGPGGHSSMPPPHTSVGRVAAAVARLEADPFPARIDGATAAMLDHLGPEMPWHRRAALANRWLVGGLIARQFSAKPSLNALLRTTTAATVIHGGKTPNVLPGRAEAFVNVRLLPGDTAESALARIRAVVDDPGVTCSLQERLSEASPVSSIESGGFRVLQRTISEVYPGAVVAPGLSMVATDSRHYAAIADDVYRFLPLRVTSRDLGRIHGVDERIAVEDYADLIGFLARLIRNLSDTELERGGRGQARSTTRTATATEKGGRS